MTTRDPVPVLSEGMFIVLSAETAWLALIEVERKATYYEGLRLAESSTRSASEYVLQIVREFFGREAQQALPAETFEALAFYLEHYEGRLQERVRQLAAVLLSGQLWATTSSEDGGTRVPVTDRPQPPTRPGGATFDIKSDVPVAEAVS